MFRQVADVTGCVFPQLHHLIIYFATPILHLEPLSLEGQGKGNCV
jgi:hypothetical protein